MRQLLITLGFLSITAGLHAAPVTYQFSGITNTGNMAGNGGTLSTVGVPNGTPYSGSFTYDGAQVVTPVAFDGGTHAVYTFTSMTLTMLGSTVTWGPGTIDVYNNLTLGVGYPVGDSLYVNISSLTPPTGSFGGVSFNWIFLGFVDSTGTAFSSATLPANLNLASFQSYFIEFNFSWAAGITSQLQFLSTLSNGTPSTPPTITTTSLPPGVYGVPYSQPVTASGPNGDVTTVTVTGLPAGLSYSGGSIIGTPGAVGTSSVTITATDSITKLSTSSTLPLTINDAAITFAPANLPNGVTNSAYSTTFAAATGGTGVFSYTAAGLPTGLSLSGLTISGTPTTAATSTITLTATDTAGYSKSATVTLNVTAPVPVPCSGSNAVESAYVPRNPGFITVNGGLNLLDHLWTTNLTASNVTFLGGLVNWYQTGLILSWNGTVDPSGCILTNLTVAPAVTISTTTLPNASAGLAYSAPVAVGFGVPPYKTSASGLPTGLTFNGTSITGTPTVAGSFTVVVTAVDAVNATATKSLTLTVADQPIAFSPVLPAGTVGVAYSATLSATGYGPFAFSATGLPAGLTLSGNVISGTPTTAGVSAVSLTATDALSTVATASLNFTINAASAPSYTIQDESQGKITAIGAGYLMVGTKKLIWNSSTYINVNTDQGNLHTITSFVKVGMIAQWKGLRDKATNTVLTSQLEIN